ncbi:MAG: metal-dependent hydrolase [Alphaproteobacteria bacterium]|jgi:L-ascorbate metabolism protein UlaG (beta-lactamase superfamily)|nr:metal-dependent hydrolase [Alphaproteobacteria bacterium]MDP6564944.1 metal-dependent hydrolase [Alphaproteobacteria bacterium]
MDIQWLGHSAFRIEAAGKTILVDPYFTGNPTFPEGAEDAIDRVDHILLTHGHEDHLGDTVRLAQTYGAEVVAVAELAYWLEAQGVEKRIAMNIGGTVTANGLSFSMVQAIHSASVRRDGKPIYMGACAGFVIRAGDKSVYHAGDTDIFSDMALIQKIHQPRVGLIPIGGYFTMSASTAAMACNDLLDLEVIVPMHFATFPVLAKNPEEFEGLVRRGTVKSLRPGETLNIP